MTKYCGNCGSQMNDNARVCGQCGTPFGTLPKTNKQSKKALIIVCVISVVFVCGVGYLLFGGRSYQKVVKQYIAASLKPDAEAIIKLAPSKVIDYNLEQDDMDRDDLDDLIDDMNDNLDDNIDAIDSRLGKDWDVDYEITDVFDKDEDELERIKDEYEDAGVKISDAQEVKVELTVTSDEDEYENSLYVPLVKVGRSWYLDMLD